MRKLLTLLSTVVTVLALQLAATSAARERAIIDLGSPGLESWALGVNNAGDVVGTADAVDVVLDVAKHEVDLLGIAEMVDDFQLVRRRGLGCRLRAGATGG